MKYFCFRFDVDTHKCMQEGVPNLIQLGEELGVPFTFFINMGEAISLKETFLKILSKKKKIREEKNESKFSPLKKLGKKDYLIAALLNPKTGFNNINIIKELIEKGHEFGLHGGRNHAKWQNNAHKWEKEKIREELKYTLKKLKKHGINSCKSFCSPGFTCNSALHEVLHELGFKYASDSYDIEGPKTEGLKEIFKGCKLPNLNVNITPDNRTAYIENLRSRGFNDDEIIKDFSNQLSSSKKIAIVYEHPYYAGIQELDIIRKMVIEAKKQDFTPTTMMNIYENCTSNA